MSIDITLQILETLKVMRPDNTFISSLHSQYCNRGGLSRKQMEGLLEFSQKSSIVSQSQLATLEAIIRKKPVRYKSEKILKAPEPEKRDNLQPLLSAILSVYPEHKMALFLQNKVSNHLPVSQQEINELIRLHGLIQKEKK